MSCSVVDVRGLSCLTRNCWCVVGITLILLIYSITYINEFPGTTPTTPTTTETSTKTETPTPTAIPSTVKWAFATLYPRSEPPSVSGEFSYRQQVCILLSGLQSSYPNIPKLLIVGKNHITQKDQEFFTRIGFTVLEREIRQPAYGSSMKLYSGIYEDQFMKFYLWNELSYDYIIYLDADHYVFKPVNFTILLQQYQQLQKIQQQQQQQQRQQQGDVHQPHQLTPIIACPTPWSKLVPSADTDNNNNYATASLIPLTWNGGFFVLSPNRAVYEHLWNDAKIPTHFTTHYPQLAMLDTTEMGTFARDFPLWSVPVSSLLIPVCGEINMCCPYVAPGEEPRPAGCKSNTAGGAILNKGKPSLVHGLKPKPGWLSYWTDLGYNGTCLMSDIYPYIQEQTQKYTTCQVT